MPKGRSHAAKQLLSFPQHSAMHSPLALAGCTADHLCDRTLCDDTEGVFCACRYSKHPRLRLLRRWRMPTEEDIGEGGLPCEGYPSDHISLCAVFEIS